uniref:Uncharacterized protein n=1 Tax=Arion vulgaris TaxID=1028688 RepID=A0A0B7AZC2_9EUPU
MGVIDDVMSKCTFDIAMDVEYEYLKPHLISIFPKLILQRAEGRDRASYEIMIEICDKVPKYGMDRFLQFVAALKQVNEYVFKKINNEYKVKTGNYLPGFEEVENNIFEPAASSSEISQQHVTPPIIESSSPEINSAATMDMSQSGEMSASERVNSHLISTLPAENLESNAVSGYIQYVSYGAAVPCPSDMLHQQENQIVLDSSVQLNIMEIVHLKVYYQTKTCLHLLVLSYLMELICVLGEQPC